MLLNKLILHNFLSFEDAKLDLNDRGILLVIGQNEDDDSFNSNGSGKSTIIESLFWCLFGTTLRGLRGDDVVRRGSKDCSVSVLGIHDNKNFEITRKREGNKPYFTIHYDNEILEGEKADKWIEDNIGDKDIFRTIVTVDTSFLSLSEPQRRAWIEQSLGIDWIDKAKDVAKEAQINAQQEIRDKDTSISTLEIEQKKIVEQEDQFNKESDIKQLQSDLDNEKSKDNNLQLDISYNLEETESINKTIETLKIDLDNKQTEIDNAKKILEDNNHVFIGELGKLEIEKLDVGKKISNIEKEINNLGNLGSTCITCKQPITKEHIENVLSELKPHQRELEEKRQELIKVYDDKKKEFNDTSILHENKIKQFTEDRTNIDRSIKDNGTKQQELTSKYRGLLNEQSNIKGNIARIEEKIKSIESFKNKLRQDKERINEQLKELNQSKEELIEIEKKFGYWVNIFDKDLRIYLINTVVHELNGILNQVSSSLLGSSLMVKFTTEEKKKTVTKNAFTIELNKPYTSLSSGEKKRVDIVVLLALFLYARRRRSINLLFLDEVFENLDNIGMEGTIDTLHIIEKLGNVGSIFVITHDSSLSENFNKIIKVVKKNNISKLEE